MSIKTNESLATIIRTARHPKRPDAFVSSDEIAEAVNDAGYFKWADRFEVNRQMVNEALMAYFPGIQSIGELKTAEGGEHQNAEQRMVNAIYAAFRVWTQNSKDICPIK
jgi:hypothetical protein